MLKHTTKTVGTYVFYLQISGGKFGSIQAFRLYQSIPPKTADNLVAVRVEATLIRNPSGASDCAKACH